MIYLQLFLQFLKIGAVAFGGGYGMLAVIEDTTLRQGWLTAEEMVNFVAVSESTPGPIAINLATFIGSKTGGVLGAALATLGVILPAFLLILLIVTIAKNLLKFEAVSAVLAGIRPTVVGLICSVACTMGLSVLFGVETVQNPAAFDWRGLVILALILAVHFFLKHKKKKVSPILMIVFSAVLGILFYGL